MTAVRAPRRSREAGFTLIDMLFVVALTGLLMTMAIPGMMRARGVAQVSSALGTIRTVNSAQLSYAITCGLGFYAPDFPTLAVKPPAATEGFISADLASGMTFVKSGYNFSMAGTAVASAPGTCNGLDGGRRLDRLRGGRRSAGSSAEPALLRQQRRRHGLRKQHLARGDHARERRALERLAAEVAAAGSSRRGLCARRATADVRRAEGRQTPLRFVPAAYFRPVFFFAPLRRAASGGLSL